MTKSKGGRYSRFYGALRDAWTALPAYATRKFLRRFEYEVTVVDVEHDVIIAQLVRYS